MALRMLGLIASITLLTDAAMALDGKSYAGVWAGRLKSGTPVQLNIPANVDKGGIVTYFYDGAQQAPQQPVVIGETIRLNNPGSSYIIIGPVKGKQLPYYWTNGSNEARATLSRQ